jgi:hypothetical protein
LTIMALATRIAAGIVEERASLPARERALAERQAAAGSAPPFRG